MRYDSYRPTPRGRESSDYESRGRQGCRAPADAPIGPRGYPSRASSRSTAQDMNERIQTDRRSETPAKTPMASPRSPNFEGVTTDPRKRRRISLAAIEPSTQPITMRQSPLANSALRGTDQPVRTEHPPRSPPTAESGSMMAKPTTMASYLQSETRIAAISEQVDQAKTSLKNLEKEEDEIKQRHPNHRALVDAAAFRTRRQRKAVDELEEAQQKAHKASFDIFSSLTLYQQAFLSDETFNHPPSKSVEDVPGSVTQKMERLEKRFQDQEEEIKELRRLLSTYDGLRIELKQNKAEVIDRMNTFHNAQNKECEDVNMRIGEVVKLTNALGDKIDSNDRKLSTYQSTIAAQQNVIDSQQKILNKLEADVIRQKSLSEIKQQIDQHTMKFTGLNNDFVPKADYHRLRDEIEVLKKAEVATRDYQQNSLCRMNDMETGYQEIAIDLTRLKDKTTQHEEDLSNTMEALVKQVQSIEHDNVAKTQTPSTPVDLTVIQSELQKGMVRLAEVVDTFPTLQNDLNPLKTKVNNLARAQEASKSIAKELAAVNERLDKYDANVLNLQNGRCVDGACLAMQDHQSSTNAGAKETTQHLADKLIHVEQQYNKMVKELEQQLNQKIDAQTLGPIHYIQDQVNQLRAHATGNAHAISNLDIRFNSLTTQRLYQEIVRNISPLGQLCETLQEEHTKLSKTVALIESQSSEMKAFLDTLKTNQVSLNSNIDDAHLQQHVHTVLAETSWARSMPDLQQQVKDVGESVAQLTRRIQIIERDDPSVEDLKSKMTSLESIVATKLDPEDLKGAVSTYQAQFAVLRTESESTISEVRGKLDAIHDKLVTVDGINKSQTLLSNRLREELDFLTKALEDAGVTGESSLNAALQALEQTKASNLRMENDVRNYIMTQSKEQTNVDNEDLRKCIEHVETLQNIVNGLNARFALVIDADPLTFCTRLYSLLANPSDSYIQISQVASTVTEDYVRDKLGLTKIRMIWFEGDKPQSYNETGRTNRISIVQIPIDSPRDLIEKLNGKRWKGRKIEIRQVTRGFVLSMLLRTPGMGQSGGREVEVPSPDPQISPPIEEFGPATVVAEENAAVASLELPVMVSPTITLNQQARIDALKRSQQASSSPRKDEYVEEDYLDGWGAHTGSQSRLTTDLTSSMSNAAILSPVLRVADAQATRNDEGARLLPKRKAENLQRSISLKETPAKRGRLTS